MLIWSKIGFGASNFDLFDPGEYEGEGEDVPLPE